MKSIKLLLAALLLFPTILRTSTQTSIQAVLLAAGGSTRFRTGISKLCYPICGQEMIMYPVTLLAHMNIHTTLVVGFQQEYIRAIVNSYALEQVAFVEQKEQRGTGHALLCSQPLWHANDILVMNGDVPLVSQDIVEQLITQHNESNAAVSLVVAHNVDPADAYGRIVQENGITKIIEAKHFLYDIRDYPLINAGIYLINRAFLQNHLSSVGRNEITHEFYITDLIEIASTNGYPVVIIEAPFDTIRGVNTLKELAAVQQIKQTEIIDYWMTNGVRFNKPETNHVDINVTIEPGTFIDTGVHLRNGTIIGKNCFVGAYTILDKVVLPDESEVSELMSITDIIFTDGETWSDLDGKVFC